MAGADVGRFESRWVHRRSTQRVPHPEVFVIAFLSLAYAGNADLKVTHTMPANPTVVETNASISVKVENVGTSTAFNTTLTIELPQTHTSPTVYIQGMLGTYDGRCTLSGQTLTCSLGLIKKFKSTTVTFDFAPVWANEPLEFSSSATTTSVEVNTSNNSDVDALAVSYVSTEIVGPVDVTNDHCTGTNLVSYWECDCVGSAAITSHDATFESDGTITFPLEPSCSGTWSQPVNDLAHLSFEYTCSGTVVANFEGDGIGGDCFHGITTFPGSTFVSPYQVCPN